MGGGPAGITLAREFIGSARKVCVLESGGFDLDLATQALTKGQNVGFQYYDLGLIRPRIFGGSSSHWGGVCRPLDATDFEHRDWVPHSGWPLSRAQLDPYYARAQPLCQLGPYDYDLRNWVTPTTQALPLASRRLLTAFSQFSPLTRFGQLYREEIGGASNISVLLCGNLVEIETTPNAREVLRLHAAYIGGGRFTIRARAYILAAGAIENARLLLASDRHRPAGVGNDYDVVGRYFGEHLTVSGAFFLASRDDLVTDLYNSLRQFGVKRCAYLVPSPETQQTERLLNMRTWLDDVAQLTALRWSGPGIQAADDLVEALRRGEVPDDLPEHLWRAITDLDNISMYAYFTFLEPKKKIPAFLLTSHIEQAPNPESRVTLSDERDELGMRRVKLDWRFGELEKHTFRRGMEILGEEVGRAGLGRVRVIPEGAHLEGPEFQDGKGRLDRSQVPDYSGWPPPGVRGSYHHLGTTRMASDPRNGVVDADCRVHGIANLYVAGSSVFPTVGYTNPTLTIVALSLRLADHVKALLT